MRFSLIFTSLSPINQKFICEMLTMWAYDNISMLRLPGPKLLNPIAFEFTSQETDTTDFDLR